MSHAENPNCCTYMSNNYDNHNYLPDFDLLEYLAFINQSEEDSSSTFTPSLSQSPPISCDQEMTSYTESSLNSMPVDGLKRGKKDAGLRIAFRMKTELEIIDDGYKWRKYGKKMIKNSPNPRNYYKCSSGGCSVKKRVERDGQDSSYVITAYDGVHNHHSPSFTTSYIAS